MLFLNPVILFGLLAASIPVLIHLLNLRKLKKIDFSTLAFLKELQKNKIKKIKLKQWLLLALRVLIIIFLVMAFARPALKGVAIGGTTSAAKTTAVFILDNSFSMSVVDSKGSYFNQAKETIKELIKQLQEGDDASLITIAGGNDEEMIGTNNLADFSSKVEQAEISYASGYLHDALIKASKIVSASKNFNKEIYILSDFQSDRLAKEGSLSDLSQILNEKVKIYSFNYSGKEVFNLGIDNLKINTRIFEKDKPVSFDLTVENFSKQSAEDAVVSIFINGERSAQQSVDIQAGESARLTMEAPVKNTGYINIYAELQDDEIIYDNRRYADLFIPPEIPVIIFADDPEDASFVSLALTVSEKENLLKVTVKNTNQISSTDLSQVKTIILIGTENAEGIDKFRSFLNDGGGLFIMPGKNTGEAGYSSIIQQLNLPGVKGAAGEKNQQANSFLFEDVAYEHPLFQNIFAHEEKTSIRGKEAEKIESPQIFYHFKINTEGKGRNIISLNDGTSFLSEYKFGRGKLFLMNTAPVLEWSTFPIKSIFAPLINKSVYYLAFHNEEDEEYLAGETVNININNSYPPQIKIERPDDSEEFIKTNNEQNFISYNKTGLAGIYKIYSGEKIYRMFSVNADPSESSLKYMSKSEFQDYLKKIKFKGVYIDINRNQNPAEVVLQARFGSELWKYLLLAAIILAFIEMAVARSSKKDTAEST
ncbi:MAG TPA: BatA domain-containing protein [Ignavibacteriaceae bacterium]|nr:BatA domain-containing protein [Ignavibacteriaceae bacterium]